MRDANCTRCKLNETAQFVCLIPKVKKCEVMVVGEAPGKREDETGEPFVGQSGKMLTEVLKDAGINRDEIYITNAVSCRPPGNRTPKKGEIKACRYWFQKQFTAVNPKFVLLLGNVPLESVLDLKGIKKLRGKPIERDGIIYLPTYHPAYVLREPKVKETFEADLRLFKEIIDKGEIPKEDGLNYTIVETFAQLDAMMDDLYGSVSYDIETTGLYPWAEGARINTFGFGTAKNQWILPAEHKESKWTHSAVTRIMTELHERVAEGELQFIAQNGKFDMLWTWVRFNLRFDVYFDTMIAHFLVDENQFHGLKYLSQAYFGAMDYDIDTDTKLGKKGMKDLAFYQAHDLYYTRKLKFRLQKQLDADPLIRRVFDLILMPCVNLFTEIEHHGVFINMDQFDDAEEYLLNMKAEAEAKLKNYLPKGYGEINWGSTKQLGKLLFEDLKIPIVERTKKGAPSTSESVLKRIDHPMVESLLKFREAKQQLSFFIEGWKPFLDGKRLHPNFKLHGTVTGRLSCDHPNLQQVPRDPRIRSLIGAPKGWELLEADLSQIELRIAAEMSNDRGLVHAFLNNIDPHWYTCINEMQRGGASPELMRRTASVITGKEVKNYGDACKIVLAAGNEAAEEVDKTWKELRKKAKAINFGYLYGMWWKKFKIYARDNYGVTVTDEEAQASREAYFAIYSDLPAWHKSMKYYARRHGYVRSLSGRKRRLPDAMSEHDTPERGAAERQAINSPVQSFASELNLMAALQLRKEYSTEVLYIVGTVHDALLVEVRKDYAERVYKRILEIMAHPELLDTMNINLTIPIEAEAKLGPWGKSVKLSKWKEANK